MALITSAMQMVALRDTPTRQCTRVAVPRRRPLSMNSVLAKLEDSSLIEK